MEINLKGKLALVCGASEGIGKAVAVEFADLGCKVFLFARNKEKLEGVFITLRGEGHSYVQCDLSEKKQLENAIIKIKIDCGNPDIIINNSGGPAPGSLTEANIREFNKAFNSHLYAFHDLLQAFKDSMIEKKWGRIINIISISLKQPVDNLGTSNTLRGAVGAWAKTLAGELGKYGITVNNILPGYTATQRLNSLMKTMAERENRSFKEIENRITSGIPAGRTGSPKETAYAVSFLASDLASYINGINLPVDGGVLKSL